MTAPTSTLDEARVQHLALAGYKFKLARHILLTVIDARLARGFLDHLFRESRLSFGHRRHGREAIDIGFTFDGLRALGVPDEILGSIAVKSPAFAQGARQRAARWLGDVGQSAVERWDEPFRSRNVHVWIAVHADEQSRIDAAISDMERKFGRDKAFESWNDAPELGAAHLAPEPGSSGDDPTRPVHFGLRDNIARPRIRPRADHEGKPREGSHDIHAAGELLLGYENDSEFNLWDERNTPAEVLALVGNASFGVLRRIEQDESRLNEFLEQQVESLKQTHPFVTPDYLKAKMCGRWPNGSLVMPGEQEPPPQERPEYAPRDGNGDNEGLGCPFGAHIRRTNPRDDGIFPRRARTLFRRGMPYGPRYDDIPRDPRGLMGVFFCASIEDQFERLVSEWVEKNPMGPPTPGRAKDPLVGHHDEPDAAFRIPIRGGPAIELRGFQPFVRTRGTLYALFLSRDGLDRLIAGDYDAPKKAKA